LLVALTDGPLELWEPRDRFGKRSSHFQEGLQQYTAALGEVAELGGIPAGYVDRPRADLVVRLLELVLRDEAEAGVGGAQRRFFGVTDADLYLPLLKPGQRSAVFSIQSSSADDYPGQLALHFFCLQVGSAGSPALARVEVPAWVIKVQERLDALHALLVDQCRTLGGRGYPYLLHRAHEIAVVQRGDRELLTEMTRQERLAHGLSMGRKSPKQYYKDLPGRKRYR